MNRKPRLQFSGLIFHNPTTARQISLVILLLILILVPPIQPARTAPLGNPRNITLDIQSFENLVLEIARIEDYPSGVVTDFYYRLSYLVARGAAVWNITATPTGGGECEILIPSLDILCTGEIDTLLITYNYAFIPATRTPLIFLHEGGSEHDSTDYTLTLIYPEDFTFFDSLPAPDSHDTSTRTLIWTAEDALELRPDITFQTSTLRGIWMPVVLR